MPSRGFPRQPGTSGNHLHLPDLTSARMIIGGLSEKRAGQSDEKGPAARRRPKAAGEAYLLYVEPAVEGANEADGPLSSF